MTKMEWYVIQVQSGKELEAARTIERVCSETESILTAVPLVEECFSPRYATRIKIRGDWRDISRPLLPGYVIAVTERPQELASVLHSIPRLTRLLTVGDDFVPLRSEEKVWIEEATKKGDRVVPMSIAVGKGDAFSVTEGPLKGREGLVTKVNRRKCQAIVELHVGQITIRTKVGLAILPAKEMNEVDA